MLQYYILHRVNCDYRWPVLVDAGDSGNKTVVCVYGYRSAQELERISEMFKGVGEPSEGRDVWVETQAVPKSVFEGLTDPRTA